MALFRPIPSPNIGPLASLQGYDNLTRIATGTNGPSEISISGLDFAADAENALMNPTRAETGSIIDSNSPIRIDVKIGPYKDGTHMRIREGTPCWAYRTIEDHENGVYCVLPIWRLNEGCRQRTMYEGNKENLIVGLSKRTRLDSGYYEDTSAMMYPLTGEEFRRDWSSIGVFQSGMDPSSDPNESYPIDYSTMFRSSAINRQGRCQMADWWGAVLNGQDVWFIASKACMTYDPGVDNRGRKRGGQVDLPSFMVFPFIPIGTEAPNPINFIGEYEREVPTYTVQTDTNGNELFRKGIVNDKMPAPSMKMRIRDDYPVFIKYATIMSRKRVIPSLGDIHRALFSAEYNDTLYAMSSMDVWLNGFQDRF